MIIKFYVVSMYRNLNIDIMNVVKILPTEERFLADKLTGLTDNPWMILEIILRKWSIWLMVMQIIKLQLFMRMIMDCPTQI